MTLVCTLETQLFSSCVLNWFEFLQPFKNKIFSLYPIIKIKNWTKSEWMSNFARKTTVFVPWCSKLYNSTENYLHTKVLYISSSFGLLGVESRDFSQAEKERTACKAQQIHKMTTIFTQNINLGPFWVKIVILWICSALQAVLSFSAWEKSRDSTPNSQKLEDM